MDPKLITPILMTAVLIWAIYRRVRRTIGRQPLQPGRMKARMIVLAVIGVIVAIFSFRDLELVGALVAGVVGGGVLGYVGIHHTKFEVTPKGKFYTPHTYIGLFVTLLFLGRIAYRFIVMYSGVQAVQQNQNPFAAYQKSPLTLAIFGVLIGYYCIYYFGVMKHAQKLPDFAPEPPATT